VGQPLLLTLPVAVQVRGRVAQAAQVAQVGQGAAAALAAPVEALAREGEGEEGETPYRVWEILIPAGAT
jgi:hypothetical protein